MNTANFALIVLAFLLSACLGIGKDNTHKKGTPEKVKSGNPVLDGWYADPEGIVFGSTFWIYPTRSDAFEKQTFFDAFSSDNLITWKKHAGILDTSIIKWARQALWAPSVIQNEDKYFLFFSANDIQRPGRPSWDPENDINHYGGIGIAVARSPAGPFRDYLGKPLISGFHNDAQPIDPFVFRDTDGLCYLFYGGWGHCNLGRLKDDFTGFVPWPDSTLFMEITPDNYVEGPCMFKRGHTYYFMWSEGGWADDSYKVAYSVSDTITGPFKRVGTVLESDKSIATGAGHNSVINIPGTDNWYIVYHRRPIPSKGRDHRVTCIDKLEFSENGSIRPVKMTREGVELNTVPGEGD